jgi:hypothetical protein
VWQKTCFLSDVNENVPTVNAFVRGALDRQRVTGRRETAVLRITITDLPDEQRWSLEGRLVGPWAAELSSLWREKRQERNGRKCIVELNDVTFIDVTGETALAEIMTQGAEIIAGGVYTKQRLGDLLNESKLNHTKK